MLRRVALPCLISGLLVAGLAEPAAHAAPTWLPENTLSAAGQDVQDPHVAVNPAGTAVAVWRRQDDSGHWRIQAARHPVGGAWSVTSTLSAAGESAMNPDVAINGAGSASVVWERSDGTNTRIQERHSTAAGSWSTTVDLSVATEPAINAQVVIDGHGNTTVVWAGVDNFRRRIETRRRPAGGTWSQPSWVSDAGATNANPDLAVNSAGTLVAAWSRYDSLAGLWRTQAARRPATGSWSAPVFLSGANEGALFPVAGIDTHGTASAAWRDVAGAYNVIMASRQPAGGSWSAPQSLSLPSSQASDEHLAVNAHGDAVVVWQRSDGTFDRIQVARRPAGGTWGAPVTLSADGVNAEEPDVAIGPTGDVIAAWALDEIPIQAQVRRLSAGGTWGAAVNFAPTTDTSDQPRVAFDGQSNAVAVWRWLDGPDYRTQTAALDAAGPTARITKPTSVSQKAKTFTVAWSASDRWSAVLNQDVRYHAAPVNGAFGNWVSWKSATTASSASFTGLPGRTYCFEVRARDVHNNLGAWSAQHCAAVPLDDRGLATSTGWARKTGSGYYLSTATVGSKQGATVTRTGVQTKRIALLVTKCPGCGKVTVSFGGHVLGTFSTAATVTSNKRLIAIKVFTTVRTGTLKITIASGKPVRIDGVALARA